MGRFRFTILCLTLLSVQAAAQARFSRHAETILARIRPPVFPDRFFEVTTPESSDARPVIQQAIDDCHAAGGGTVRIAAGEYLCDGPLRLKSNVNLHLANGAVVRFGINPEQYAPLVKVRWEGTVCYNYSPLIYAYRQQNIAITGQGVFDGQAHLFWHAWKRGNDGNNQDKDKPVLRQMGAERVPESKRIFGNGFHDANGDGQNDGDGQPHFLRPDLLQLYECENILLEGFQAQGSPFWTIHPVFCKNVTIRSLCIGRGVTNDDGIDPDSCQDVLIENCTIHTDDDPIAIKAGRDQDAWNRPGSRNIVVRNCTVSSKVGNGFCIGSEMSGGVENVFVQNYCVLATDNGINFKCNLDRGGYIRNVHLQNIEIDSCARYGILFQMDYHSYRGGNFPPDFRRFRLRDITIQQAGKTGIRITGVESQPVRDVRMKNVRVASAPQATEIKFAKSIRIKPPQPQ